jgi:hypothetical protein
VVHIVSSRAPTCRILSNMNPKSRLRDVLVMIVFVLVALGLAFAGYARLRTGQDARAAHPKTTR